MILGAMNRLPIKLPRRGPGRRHSSGGSLQHTVTFDDVAGVDEAKEELSEIVVCSPHLPSILAAIRGPHAQQAAPLAAGTWSNPQQQLLWQLRIPRHWPA